MSGTPATENSYDQLVTSVRNVFNSGKTRPISFRIEQLKNMARMIDENHLEILNALYRDLRKHTTEITLYELDVILFEIKTLVKNCTKWAQNEKMPFNLLIPMDTAYIRKEPLGVVLVLGAWNYPFLLTLQPALGAICAGNCVILKPSELAPHCARLMADLIPKYLDKECYHVVLAEVQGTQELLRNKFDHIFCTGSTNVGRAVMTAAAPNLTPVTLELGGKSPCYIDDSADMDIAVRRILWGKLVNLGQTCIAPDYILCSKLVQQSFIKMASTVLLEWYGDKCQNNTNIPRIVNQRHHQRLCNLLKSTQGKIVLGGQGDETDLWIEPTIVIDLPPDDALLQDEIFGPILPIITVKGLNEAIDYINSRAKPLALYTFAKNGKVNEQIIKATSSGGVGVNDTLCYQAFPGLPFGGIGNSGMGRHHGKYSFDTFSHQRSVYYRPLNGFSEKTSEARYPPYCVDKVKFLQDARNIFEYFNWKGGIYVKYLIAFLFGICVSIIMASRRNLEKVKMW